jgi:hypothetical protein
VGAHGADADEELLGDLGVGPPLGYERDQLAFPGAEPGESRSAPPWSGFPALAMMTANSTAAGSVMAAPRLRAAASC